MAEAERRKQPRFEITGPIVVTTESDEAIEGELVDMSVLGFRFYSSRVLEIGEPVSATVRFPTGQTYAANGVIRHMTETSPYCYGVAFTEETMARLIKESFGPPERDTDSERSR